MALFDRMKSQAQQRAGQLAEKGEIAKSAGQAKIDDLQAKRQVDGLLRDLGQLIYGQKTGRSSPGDVEAVDQIVESISAIEAAHQHRA